MSASKNRLRKRQSNQTALVRASEFSEYHPIFKKFESRKILTPSEKGQITRKWKQLLNIAGDNGGFGFISVAPPKIINKLKRENKENLLLHGFNILRLNQYNEGKTLDLNKNGDLIQKRKYPKAGRDDLTKGRFFTFVFVDCNFDFSTSRYDELIDDGEIYDKVKSVILKRYWASYHKRKKNLPKIAEYYLWGKQGVLYKRAASSFELLMRWLEEWIEIYLDRIIEAQGTLSDELQGWCYHANIRIKQTAKKKVRSNGKKKNSSSRR